MDARISQLLAPLWRLMDELHELAEPQGDRGIEASRRRSPPPPEWPARAERRDRADEGVSAEVVGPRSAPLGRASARAGELRPLPSEVVAVADGPHARGGDLEARAASPRPSLKIRRVAEGDRSSPRTPAIEHAAAIVHGVRALDPFADARRPPREAGDRASAASSIEPVAMATRPPEVDPAPPSDDTTPPPRRPALRVPRPGAAARRSLALTPAAAALPVDQGSRPGGPRASLQLHFDGGAPVDASASLASAGIEGDEWIADADGSVARPGAPSPGPLRQVEGAGPVVALTPWPRATAGGRDEPRPALDPASATLDAQGDLAPDRLAATGDAELDLEDLEQRIIAVLLTAARRHGVDV